MHANRQGMLRGTSPKYLGVSDRSATRAGANKTIHTLLAVELRSTFRNRKSSYTFAYDVETSQVGLEP
eukprot:9222533-Pyramimonas_sp.AAC.1